MKIKNVADLYPLSPMQQGMLFHTLYEPESGAYLMHVIATLPKHLDIPAFKKAWERLLIRHPVLRTSFLWEGLNEPLQVVREKVDLPWDEQDWRGLSSADQAERMKSFLQADRRRGFDLAKAPLMRLTLVRIDKDTSRLIWSYHHIVIDGWSLPRLFKELLAFYEAIVQGRDIDLPVSRPFRDYIAWLGRQDVSKAEDFWKELLEGFNVATHLRRSTSAIEHEGSEERTRFSPDTTAALQAAARKHQVTLNTLVHGALALVLSHQSGEKDIAFGATVSGRPVGLEGVESMVGIFINLLPMRARIQPEESLSSWLRSLQQQQFAMRQFEYYPLVQAQRWTGVASGQPLFETILTFENFPVEDTLWAQSEGLEIGDVHDVTMNNYPLTVIAALNPNLQLRFIYSKDLDVTTVQRVQQQLVATLDEFVKSPDASLKLFVEKLCDADKQQQLLDQQEREKKNLARFRKIKPKSVTSSQDSMVKTALLDPEEELVLVVSAGVEDLDVATWARDNREFINEKLRKHGTILFRDCQVDSVGKFEQLAQAVCSGLFGEYGDLPREGVSGNIYGSTPYPSDQTILFHNESSHTHRWPMKIWFHCVTAAQRGGETPIVDCRKVYQLLDPKLRERFASKKLRYVRNFTNGLDVSWEEFFRTSDKAEVEAFCRNAGIEFEWKENGLRTYKVCDAVAAHPHTGEMVFFNQLQLHHVSCLEPSLRESVKLLFDEEDLPRNVYYGDGTPIPDDVVAEVLGIYWRAARSFPWRETDVLLLDNMLTAHARNPYQGARKIVVALGEIINSTDLQQPAKQASA